MILTLLLACSQKFEAPDTGIDWPDDDGDGYTADVDCDDTDPEIHPDAVEYCDGINNDCDAAIDETDAVDASTWYIDADGDGFGSDAVTTTSCERAPGFVADNTDCDDSAASSYPGAEEICNDGIDNDCDADPDDCVLAGTFSLSKMLTITGASSADEAGETIAAGDLNGDGWDDLVVGSTSSDVGDSDAGTAFVVLGPISGGSLSDAVMLSGDGRSDGATEAMVSPGDVNGDGIDDLLAAAPGDDEAHIDAGTAFLLLGPVTGGTLREAAAGTIYGEGSYDRAGEGLAGPGDVTGDGGADLLIGTTRYGDNDLTYQGAVYVVTAAEALASESLDLESAHALITGTSRYDRAGSALSGGDVNGDGVSDVVIGAYAAPENDGVGQVAVFLGPVSGTHTTADADALLTGIDDDHYAGASVSVGDVNADGYADLCIGAPYADGDESEAGAAYVVLGSPGSGDLSTADATLTGSEEDDEAGFSVACDGDFNGDGAADVFVGAPENRTAGNSAGTSYLRYGPVSGSSSLSSADIVLTGAESRQRSGAALSAAIDADGDGLNDAIVAAPEDNSAGTDSGAVYIIFGVGL